jgi:hypothetical protein
MKGRWIGLASVIAIVAAIIIVKGKLGLSFSSIASAKPQVVLVATPAEAASIARCGEIVQAVRTAAHRGIKVQEMTPDSKSELIARYHVLHTPTVLVFDSGGEVRARFEGETQETLAAVRTELERMTPCILDLWMR